jgi:signal transduction histidine kinase
MTLFSSLTNRIFFASALLAVLTIGMAVYRVNVAVTAQAESELRRGVEEAGTLLEEYRSTLFEHFTREARLIADLSNLKAAMDTRDPATVQPLAEEYQRRIGSDLFLVTDPSGRLLAEAGRLRMTPDDPAAIDAITRAGSGKEALSLWQHAGGIVQVASVPSFLGSELMGTVSVGFSLDQEAAARFAALTNSEVAIAFGDRIQASTLPPVFNADLARMVGTPGLASIRLGDSEYMLVSRKLPFSPLATGSDEAGSPATLPAALILRSRTDRLRFLNIVHRELAGTAFLAVLAATLLSYAVARTVTRPLGTITATMREMAATGDLTRKITLSANARWEDEDARLLAATFNSMTQSISRFQREAAQRERLSSLGRLSTVVAHEIRNPLMIIKAALRGLKREPVAADQVRSAVADIDEEVSRLNRVVSDVLDFARPISFDLSPVNINALCEDAARAVSATEGPAVEIALDLDSHIGPVITDGERVRLALVNILTNARHAVLAQPATAQHQPIRLTTAYTSTGRVLIEASDRGVGINPDDLARVFDPYFTTRRTGTGLGLAISKNIVEGLGGSISVSSRPGVGTEVRIELPGSTIAEATVTAVAANPEVTGASYSNPVGGVRWKR